MIGIDEVGRGAWAGPLLVVAAALKPYQSLPLGITDSKLLTAKQREYIFEQLKDCCDWAEGWIKPQDIDCYGLTESLRRASLIAVKLLPNTSNKEIIIDGNQNFLSDTQYLYAKCIVKADNSEPIVSAASIIAKVLRDKHMTMLGKQFPQYGFEKHVGYGTHRHISALRQFGISAIHRKSYKPIAKFV